MELWFSVDWFLRSVGGTIQTSVSELHVGNIIFGKVIFIKPVYFIFMFYLFTLIVSLSFSPSLSPSLSFLLSCHPRIGGLILLKLVS